MCFYEDYFYKSVDMSKNAKRVVSIIDNKKVTNMMTWKEIEETIKKLHTVRNIKHIFILEIYASIDDILYSKEV